MQKFIEHMPRLARMAIGIILAVLMGVVDYVTGREFSFSIFYLIPIFIVVWYSGRWDGIIIALLSSFIWLVVDKMGSKGNLTDAIAVWNALVRFGFFIIIVYLVSFLRKFNIELEEKVIARTADLTAEIYEREKAEMELKNITEKLRELTERIHTIREEENKIIAREIHDELGQALTAIKIDAAWISKRYSNDEALVDSLFMISNTVDDTIKTVRKISTLLRPRLLDELGLFPAIEWQVKEFQNRTGINCSLLLPDESLTINFSASSAIFRIFQEAITNITRHSNATNVSVKITMGSNGILNMLIKDNGIGLPENYMDKEHSLGIIGMKERAISIGGNLEVVNAFGGGTEIQAEIPVKNEKP